MTTQVDTAADTAITGGLVVTQGKITPATLLISGEQITEILPPTREFIAKKTIDVSGRYILPGIIDAHLHSVYTDRIDTLSRASYNFV